MIEEGDAYALFTCSASSPSPVHIVVYFSGRLQLHNQVYRRDVQTSGSDIGGNQTFDLASFKVFECVLSGYLRDISMKKAFSLDQVQGAVQLVSFPLGLGEDDDATLSPRVYCD